MVAALLDSTGRLYRRHPRDSPHRGPPHFEGQRPLARFGAGRPYLPPEGNQRRRNRTDDHSAQSTLDNIAKVIGAIKEESICVANASEATAVEEQSATTAEIFRDVSDAARGSGEVAQNIQGVAQAAQSTSHGATDSQKAALHLAQMSTHLRELVGQFKLANGDGAVHRTKQSY